MPCGVRLRVVAHHKSVMRGQNGEGKLLYSVDAPVRDYGDKGHAIFKQIGRCLHCLLPCFLDDL